MLDNIQTVGVMAGDDGRDDDDKTIEELTSVVLEGPDYLQSETDTWLDDFESLATNSAAENPESLQVPRSTRSDYE